MSNDKAVKKTVFTADDAVVIPQISATKMPDNQNFSHAHPGQVRDVCMLYVYGSYLYCHIVLLTDIFTTQGK